MGWKEYQKKTPRNMKDKCKATETEVEDLSHQRVETMSLRTRRNHPDLRAI